MENWLKSINENRFVSQYSSLLLFSLNDTKVAVYYNVATHRHAHTKNTHETHTLKQISLSIQSDVQYFSLQLFLPLCSALTISQLRRSDSIFIRNTGAAAAVVMNLLWAILVFHLLYSIVYGFVSSRLDFFTRRITHSDVECSSIFLTLRYNMMWLNFVSQN